MHIDYRRIARLKREEVSHKKISMILGVSRNTVTKVVNHMNCSNLQYCDFELMTDNELMVHFRRKRVVDNSYLMPDFEKLEKELARKGVTMQLLWEEYFEQCQLSNSKAYSSTQFRHHFNEHLRKSTFVDVINHKAGEKIETDWAGTRPQWRDPHTDEAISGWLFVGVLPFSQYTFAYATPNMSLWFWIEAHIKMFEYFGGVSTMIVSDNLKTGVTKHTRDEVILNQTYKEMAEHYGTVIIPARVKKPRDKPSVEGSVKIMTTRIIARMRDYQFFSIDEYNKQLRIELDKINKKPFQKKDGSRYEVFKSIEKTQLKPLPPMPFEISEWKQAKVQTNSHIALRKYYYSVPHEYIGRLVKVRITNDWIQVYNGLEMLCEHKKKVEHDRERYSTFPEHMPPNSNAHSEWSKARYLNWAKQKGPNTLEVVQRCFSRTSIEQQQYKSVHALLKLADKFTTARLEEACKLGLENLRNPSYSNIKSILDNNQDLKKKNTNDEEKPTRFLRGANYYE